MFTSFPVSHWAPGSLIKSIQTAEITIAAAGTSNTATINAVTTANSTIFYGGFRTANNTLMDASKQLVLFTLTNSTTVTAATSAADAANARIARFTVVEWQPWAIKSVQSGTITLNGVTSNTATITAVNTANAFVIYQGSNFTTNNNELNAIFGRLTLTNSTTVTADKTDATTNSTIVGWAVVEFNSNIIKSVQQVTTTIAASGTTVNATISSVNTASTMLAWGSWAPDLFAVGDTTRWPYTFLANATTLTSTRIGNSAATSVTKLTVVEFYPRFVKSMNRAQTTIGSGAASNTATIAAVNTAKTLVTWNGLTDSANDAANPGTCYLTAGLTNSTTITVAIGVSSTSTKTSSWEAIEFV